MSKEQLLAQANIEHALLETARREGNYDYAQQIAGELQHTYRLLELDRLAEVARMEARFVAPCGP